MRHLVIPDTQVRPGVPTDHLRWIGQYIAEKQPGVIVHLGDHWDMPSLSHWNSRLKAEGTRYKADVQAGNEAFALLDGPTKELNRGKSRRQKYRPRKVLLRGNHEDRISRYVEEHPEVEGWMSLDDLKSPGWEVVPFLEPVEIDGVWYCHYFYNPMSGRPYSGQSMDARLKTIGCSFTMGHQQTLMVGRREVATGQIHRGLVAGSCYLHDEDYKGPQGNAHWRGVLVCNEVADGYYDLTEVSLNYLCTKYEGVSLEEFRATHELR